MVMTRHYDARRGALLLPDGMEVSSQDWHEHTRRISLSFVRAAERHPVMPWSCETPVEEMDQFEELLITHVYLATVRPDVLKFGTLQILVGSSRKMFETALVPLWQVMQGRELEKSVWVGGTEKWLMHVLLHTDAEPDIPVLFLSGWHKKYTAEQKNW